MKICICTKLLFKCSTKLLLQIFLRIKIKILLILQCFKQKYKSKLNKEEDNASEKRN